MERLSGDLRTVDEVREATSSDTREAIKGGGQNYQPEDALAAHGIPRRGAARRPSDRPGVEDDVRPSEQPFPCLGHHLGDEPAFTRRQPTYLVGDLGGNHL